MKKKEKPKHAWCEICQLITEWVFHGYQRDEYRTILHTYHNCTGCGGSRNLKEMEK